MPDHYHRPLIGQTELERMLRQIQHDIMRLKQGFDTAWETPVFENGWVNYDSGFYKQARYRRLNGWVVIQGLVRDGTAGSTIFTLPAGFRTSAGVLIYATEAGGAHGRIDMYGANDGRVVHVTGATGYVSLNIPPFPAEA